jgi:hypothetical protein
MIKNIKWLLLGSIVLVACNKNDETVATDYGSSDGMPLTAGTANFTKYVSLGNSLTSGFCDNALFKAGQEYSYPNILSQQFALVGGGAFKIPYCGSDNLGGLTIGGTIIQGTRMAFNGLTATANPSPNPNLSYAPGIYPIPGTPVNEITNPAVSAAGPYNNVGVPGAKSYHLLSPDYGKLSGVPVGTANPYFARFMSQASPVSMLTYATAQTPTFFSLWIGNNDVLSYATSGGTGVNQTGNLNPATYGGNDITDPNVFASVYNNLINGMTAGGAKGVVANIPYVTTIPFFTTVPTNPVPLTNATQVAQLNGLFGAMNAMLIAGGKTARFQTLQVSDLNPYTTTYSKTNPLLISDESADDATAIYAAGFAGAPFNYPAATAGFLANLYKYARHANASGASKDYIVLTARSTIGATQPGYPATNSTIGVTYPMPDNATITYNEAAIIKTATDAYNATISSLATAKGLAFVDANAIMSQVANGGIGSNGYLLTNTYATGGAFSFDGVHPCQRGYALIANKFLEAINKTYGSNLKGVDLSKYRIAFPASL